MATRLNQFRRNVLSEFADANVKCDAEQKIADKAYAQALKLARADVEKKFPAADMAVLDRYGVAEKWTFVTGGDPDGAFVRLNLRDADAVRLPHRGCGHGVAFRAQSASAIAEHERATKALREARREKRKAYAALIISANTFEEVVEAWPAVEVLRDRICAPSNAVVALSNEVREFIRADNAGSQERAAA